MEDNALIVQRTTRRRSRGVITRVQRPLRPALGKSWALRDQSTHTVEILLGVMRQGMEEKWGENLRG